MTIQDEQIETIRQHTRTLTVSANQADGKPQGWFHLTLGVEYARELIDALDAGAAALSRQREQDDQSRSAHPSGISDGDQRGDDRDDPLLTIEQEDGPPMTVSMIETELAACQKNGLHGSAFGLFQIVVSLKNRLKSGRWLLVPADMALLAVQPSAALSQPSRQLENDDGAGLAAVGNDTGPSPTETASWREARAAGAGWLNQYGATSMEGVIIKNLLAAPLTEARELTYKKMRLFEPNMSAFNALGQLLNEIDALISKQEIAWKTQT